MKRFLGSVRHAIFKVSFDPAYQVGYVREAKHCAIAGLSKRVESGRLHFHVKNAGVLLPRRSLSPFSGMDSVVHVAPDWIGIPAAASASLAIPSDAQPLRCVGRRQVVIAGPFVAQRMLDDNQIREPAREYFDLKRSYSKEIGNPTQTIPRRREPRKRGFDDAAQDAIFMPAFVKDIEIGVVASPTGVTDGRSSVAQISNHVAVGDVR